MSKYEEMLTNIVTNIITIATIAALFILFFVFVRFIFRPYSCEDYFMSSYQKGFVPARCRDFLESELKK